MVRASVDFAAAGFAHEPKHLAPLQRKRDAVDRFHRAGLSSENKAGIDREMGLEIVEFENRFRTQEWLTANFTSEHR